LRAKLRIPFEDDGGAKRVSVTKFSRFLECPECAFERWHCCWTTIRLSQEALRCSSDWRILRRAIREDATIAANDQMNLIILFSLLSVLASRRGFPPPVRIAFAHLFTVRTSSSTSPHMSIENQMSAVGAFVDAA
jgi:hypothetical protein